MATLGALDPAAFARQTWITPNGTLTREALRFLEIVVARLGGSSSITVTDLQISDDDDGGLEEFRAETFKALDALRMLPEPQEHTAVDQLQAEVVHLRELVASLIQQINDLQTGPIYGGHS